MARWEFKLPDIGEGITEGEIVHWLVQRGDVVREDQPVVELMTDKATVTITAPKAGTVVETRGTVGEVVPVHAVLVVFEVDGAIASQPAHEANGATQKSDGSEHTATVAAAGPGYFNEKPLATPATRKLARDMNIDLRTVVPSGAQGRVTKRDLESIRRPAAPGTVAVRTEQSATAPASAASGLDHGPAREARRLVQLAHGPLEERIPFAGLRRKIAHKMALSKQTAAHFTFVEECDVTELEAAKARLVGPAQAQGVKLTYLPFIVKATACALRKHPMLNTALDEATNELVFRKYFHIGIATATEAGLLVPVVRDADKKSILEIARDIERLAAEARAGSAKLEDLVGSTFTITSLGAQGGLLATPIINFPEVAILGVHRIKRKAVVKNDQIVVGDVMLVSLSFDHRIVDGQVGAAFAYEVIGYIEHPDRLLLEMA